MTQIRVLIEGENWSTSGKSKPGRSSPRFSQPNNLQTPNFLGRLNCNNLTESEREWNSLAYSHGLASKVLFRSVWSDGCWEFQLCGAIGFGAEGSDCIAIVQRLQLHADWAFTFVRSNGVLLECAAKYYISCSDRSRWASSRWTGKRGFAFFFLFFNFWCFATFSFSFSFFLIINLEIL